MALGATIVNHFDLVNYILKKYRTMMITEIAEVFNMNVMVVYDVYDALGIDPLEMMIKNYKEKVIVPIDDDDLSKGHEEVEIMTQYKHIIPSRKQPNRKPTEKMVRPPAVYPQNSPMGIADELHRNLGSFLDKENKDAKD